MNILPSSALYTPPHSKPGGYFRQTTFKRILVLRVRWTRLKVRDLFLFLIIGYIQVYPQLWFVEGKGFWHMEVNFKKLSTVFFAFWLQYPYVHEDGGKNIQHTIVCTYVPLDSDGNDQMLLRKQSYKATVFLTQR